jgi:hypothetical protein
MTLRTATCHCRRLTLNCEGEPAKVSMCHCTDCQRRTGSLFSIAVFYERDRISVASGETRQFERPSASGFPVTFNFCPNCGSNLFWEPARMPHLVGVAVGGFEDPAFPRPSQAVWVKDRHDWLDLPNDLPQHAVNPPPRAPAPRE